MRKVLKQNNRLRGFSTSAKLASQYQTTEAPPSFSWSQGNYDPTQIAQMQDMMTLVDENDNIVGPISKLNGHLLL